MVTNEEIKQLRDKLFAALEEDDLQKVKECIENAESRRIKNEIFSNEKHGMNPIYFATYRGNLKILQFLLDNGVDVNAISDGYLVASLHVAAMSGKPEVGQFLLDCDANINATNNEGFTPLHFASYYCHLGMVKLLLCNDADANIQDTRGKTALDIVGDYGKGMCNSNSEMQEIVSILNGATEVNCKAILTSTKANIEVMLEADDITDVTSSAVRPSSFINSIFSWVETSTTAALDQSTSALPLAQQPIAYSAGSSISSSQVDFSGIALLADIVVRRFTGERYSRLLDDSLLTLEEIKERKLNAIERDLNIAMSKFNQFPESSLNNATISKVIDHQKFF